MQYTVLLNKDAIIRDIEAEEQTRFIMSVIEALEVPFDWDPNEPFSVLDKVRLRKVLNQYHISIIDDMAGGVKIYLENDKIAEFFKPRYVLKEDPSQIDPKKKLFIEMHCDFNSLFENAS